MDLYHEQNEIISSCITNASGKKNPIVVDADTMGLAWLFVLFDV